MPYLHVYSGGEVVLPATKSNKNPALSEKCYLIPLEMKVHGESMELYGLVTESTGDIARVSEDFAVAIGLPNSEGPHLVGVKYLTADADGEEKEHYCDLLFQVGDFSELPGGSDYFELGWKQFEKKFNRLGEKEGAFVFVLKNPTPFSCTPH